MINIILEVNNSNLATEKSTLDFLSNPEFIISTCALIISAVGLYIGARYNRKTFDLNKRHHLLSVKPIVAIIHETSKENQMKLICKNEGLGPAIIDSIYYHSRATGTKYRSIDLLVSTEFPDIYNDSLEGSFIATQIFNYTLSAKSEIILYDIILQNKTKEWLDISKNCGVIASFRSIYDENFIKSVALNPYKNN